MSGSPHASSREEGRLLRFAFPLAALILVRLLCVLFPSSGWWGVNYARFLPPWQYLMISGLALLAVLPRVAASLTPMTERIAALLFPASSSRARTTHILAAIAFGICAGMLTMPYPFLGGDGVHVMRRLFRFNVQLLGDYGQLSTEPLTVLLYAGLAKLSGAGSVAGGSVNLTGYTMMFRVVGGVGASVLAFAVLRFSQRMSDINTERLALVSMLLFTAGTLMYFGYVEFYVPVFTVSALFLLSGMRALREGTPVVLPGVLLALAVVFHFSAIVFLPAYIFLLTRRLPCASGRWQTVSAMRVQALLLIAAFAGAGLVYAADVKGPWIALLPLSGVHTMYSLVHLHDVMNNVLLTAPMALAAMFMLLPERHRHTSAPQAAVVFTAVAALWWIVLIVSQPSFAHDWDIFPVFGLTIACGAWLLLARLPFGPRRSYLRAQMMVQPMLFLLPWMLLHMNQEAALARYGAITERYAGVLPAAVLSGFHETLRSEAVARADGGEEIRQIAAMIELTGERYEYMKLLRALARRDPGVEHTLGDVRIVLARLSLQSDSLLDLAVGDDTAAREKTLRSLYPVLVTTMGSALAPEARVAWLEETVNPALRLGRAFPILAQLGHLAFDGARHREALSWYGRAVDDSVSSPDDGGAALSQIYSNMGIAQFAAQRPEDALRSFAHATIYPSAPARAWSNLGFACFRLARFDDARRNFTLTLAKDSSDVNALYCLGRLSLQHNGTVRSGRWLLRRFLSLEQGSRRSEEVTRWLALQGGS